MQLFSTTLLLGVVSLQSVLAWTTLSRTERRQKQDLAQSVEDFITTESPIALEQLLCNIGSDGCHASGVNSGLVIASPSKEEPPYFYTWTRDSALVFKSVVDRFVNEYDADLQRHITEYIASQAHIQGVSNPSGSLADGSGLGEPKFNVDGSAFTDSWGRPQRDGPALRAIAIMSYGEWLVDNNYTDTAKDILWPIVRNDLNYVTQYWNQTGFDLWEEVKGSSFFTVASQHKALVQGYSFAARIGVDGEDYASVAPSVLCFLQTFWSSSAGFVDANIVDSFRFYNINSGIPKGTAIAVGRYAEDVYYGGNPWYLNTLAVAEQLYDAVYVWKQQGSITVTETSRAFFADLVSGVAAGTYKSGSGTFNSIIEAVSAYADGFVDVVATYAQQDGSLDEQFSKSNGQPLSATDLTWSYASFLTAVARRAGIVPRPWADSVETVPGTCNAATVAGTYASATKTNFPPSQTPITGSPPSTTKSNVTPPPTSTGCSIASKVTVTFNVRATTVPGQTIKVVGSVEDLGNWDPAKGVALDASDYQANDPLWKGKIVLAAGEAVEYKYIRVESGGSVKWEADPNRQYRVPRSCEPTAKVSDTWR
ncbi:glycosyl hydrolases family 15 domain-containing protein [Sarocladium implicatum]|nr:glycosyl hydrolases family 15 domain-containing protein [Sarocladium implicatum]